MAPQPQQQQQIGRIAAASDPSGGGESTTTTAAASDPLGTNTANGVDSTTEFLSRNYTWFGKEVPDNTPLNTSPGITWEQYRIFSNIWKDKHGISVCHLCKMLEITPIGNSEQQIRLMDQLEYIIVDNSVVPAFNAGGGNNNHAANGSDAVQPQPQQQSNSDYLRAMADVPAFNAPSNISVSNKSTTKRRELSFDHHPYGMTDGEEDVSKAMLCSMLCSFCNLRLGYFERILREEGTLAYFYSVFSREYITRVLEYIRQKNYYQLLIGEWHKSIHDKNELCVSSCHSGMALACKTQPKIIKVCTDQLERLRKNNVEITKLPRVNVTKWVGATKGLAESTVSTVHITRRLTI